jgi:hypothetical protein
MSNRSSSHFCSNSGLKKDERLECRQQRGSAVMASLKLSCTTDYDSMHDGDSGRSPDFGLPPFMAHLNAPRFCLKELENNTLKRHNKNKAVVATSLWHIHEHPSRASHCRPWLLNLLWSLLFGLGLNIHSSFRKEM